MAEKQMSLARALDLYNKDKKNEAAQEVIKDRIGHRAVIALDASGQIVVADTLENLDIAKSYPGNDDQADCVSPSKLFAAAQPKFKGDPIDRRLLRSSGVTVTEPKVDWGMVPDDLRLVAAYAAESGEIDNTATASESAVYNLRQPPTAWAPPWPRMAQKWDKLCKLKGKTDSEKALVARVEARLWVPQRPFDRSTDAADLVGELRRGVPNPQPGGPNLLVVHVRRDQAYFEALKMHLAQAQRRGLVLTSIQDVPPGAITRHFWMEKFAAATVIVVLVTPELQEDWGLIEATLAVEKRIIPIKCKVTLMEATLAKKAGLPRQRWLTGPSDNDGWFEIATDLANL